MPVDKSLSKLSWVYSHNWIFSYPVKMEMKMKKKTQIINFSLNGMRFKHAENVAIFTTYNFQSVERAWHRRHRLNDDNSCIRTNAIDSFRDHILRWFWDRLFHRNRQPHTIVHLQRPNPPNKKHWAMSTKWAINIMNFDLANTTKSHLNRESKKMLTPLRLDVIATIGLQVFVCGLYRSADDNSMQSSRPPTA